MVKYIFNNEKIFVNHILDEHPNPDEFYMHAHETMELYYFISGSGTFWAEGVPYPLKPHDIMIFGAGEAHCIDISPDTPYERIVFNLSCDIFPPESECKNLLIPFFERSLGAGNLFSSDSFEDDFYRRCILRIVNDNNISDLQIYSNLYPLLNEILCAFNRRKLKTQTVPEHLSSKILLYINQNISRQITPDSIAEAFFISRSYLYSLFKATTGSSVWEYITVKRLLLAKELLVKGNRPSVVYTSCGFNDYSVFYRSYKAKFGVSPKEDYRKV